MQLDENFRLEDKWKPKKSIIVDRVCKFQRKPITAKSAKAKKTARKMRKRSR